MATLPSATPTPITPPRVPLIDERTGLIDRAWYMFFLSLFRAAETTDSAAVGPSTESLIASYDAALLSLTQTVETQPPQTDCCVDIDAVRQEVQSAPPAGVAELTQEVSDARQQLQTLPLAGVAELTQEVNDLRQEVQTIPRPQLGTFAALQQANLPWTTFDTTAQSVPTDIGTVAWDGGTTLGVQMTANVLLKVGEAEYIYAKASATITKGQVCYHTGAVGSSGVTTVAPAPIGLTDSNLIVGIAAESIALNDFGLIQISGDIKGFDTTGSSVGETWADGDSLYYNPAYVGSMTKVKPSAPNQKTYMGEVINAGSGGSGSMHIRITPGSMLGGTDSNVQFGTLANNDLIQYSTTLGYWTNVGVSSISIGTATNLAGGLAGSVPYQSAPSTTTFLGIGAANRVLTSSGTAPQWSTSLTGLTGVSTTTLSASSTVTLSGGTANGVLYLNGSNVVTSGTGLVFNGSNLGIGTSSPVAKLSVADATAPKFALQVGAQERAYLQYTEATFTTRLDSDGPIQLAPNNTLAATLDNSGNIGIGTSSPANRLQVTASNPGYWNGTGWTGGSGIPTAVVINNSTLGGYDPVVIGQMTDSGGASKNSFAIGTVGTGAWTAGNNATQIADLYVAVRDNAGGITERARITSAGNFGIGTSSFGTSAAKVLSIGSGTEPTSGPADTVQFYSVDRSAGNTIPAFYCEGSGVTNAGITSTAVTHKIAMKINGTIYYLLATTNAT